MATNDKIVKVTITPIYSTSGIGTTPSGYVITKYKKKR